MTNEAKLTRQDFASSQEVRWCPGCGDYAILTNIQKALPALDIPKEKYVFVSGIGCASRFPYYMNTYGFHTIHGRAPAVATGLKIARPDLSVWVVTGDGDGLSIGANHLVHLFRRNLDINVLLFNNRIYGLTKGQYSPTSEVGKVTKTTPQGSIDSPLNAISLALSSNATFVARCFDIDGPNLQALVQRAAKHKGTAFIEIFQNCNVFNDDTFADISHKTVRAERTLWLEDGKPLLFGKEKEKGLRFNQGELEICDANDKDVIIHNAHRDKPYMSFLLSQLNYPEFPVPMGVFREVNKPTYVDSLQQQVEAQITKQGEGDLEVLLHSGTSWDIK